MALNSPRCSSSGSHSPRISSTCTKKDDLLLILSKNIINKEKVKISKFGTFIVKHKNSRVGRNPKTKEEKLISARSVITFKASNEFKKFLNSDRKI